MFNIFHGVFVLKWDFIKELTPLFKKFRTSNHIDCYFKELKLDVLNTSAFLGLAYNLCILSIQC